MRKNKTRLERQPLSAVGLERVSELEPNRAELADEAAKAAACFEKRARDTQRTLHMSTCHPNQIDGNAPMQVPSLHCQRDQKAAKEQIDHGVRKRCRCFADIAES